MAAISGPTFGGPITITLNPSRIQIETRVYPINLQANGRYNGSATQNFSQFSATGSVSGQITGNQINGSENLTFTAGCGAPEPPKIVIYSYTGNKNQ